MEGIFDYNKTPMVPLGTKAIAYLTPDERASWQMHGYDAYYVGPATKHYRLLKFYDPTTCNYNITGTYELYPGHCKVPSISKGDCTILAATKLLCTIDSYVPTTAANKCAHAKVLKKLSTIMGMKRWDNTNK